MANGTWPINAGEECSYRPAPNLTSLRAERLRLRRFLFERGELPSHAGRAEAESVSAVRNQYDLINKTIERILRGRYGALHYSRLSDASAEFHAAARENRSGGVSSSMDSDMSAQDPPMFIARDAQLQEASVANIPSSSTDSDPSALYAEEPDIPLHVHAYGTDRASAAGRSWLNRFPLFCNCKDVDGMSRLPSKVKWMEEGQIERKYCPICFEYKEDIIQFPHARSPDGDSSDHKMCRECFIKNGNNVCPMCRGHKEKKKKWQNVLLYITEAIRTVSSRALST